MLQTRARMCLIGPTGIGSPELPFEYVRILAARGAADTALAVQRARGGHAALALCTEDEALDEADTLLRIRLHCGAITEAFTEVLTPLKHHSRRSHSVEIYGRRI